MAHQITAWSFSRWQTYQNCPAKAKYKYIDKLPEPFSGPAAERGTAIHKLAEDYAKGEIKKLPVELIKFKDEFGELRKSKPMVEQEWAFTNKWIPTGWFDYNTWLRVKVDAACYDGDTLYVIDHKTGKRKDDHVDQLSLYAAAGFLQKETTKYVSTHIWYIDHGEQEDKVFKVEELPNLIKSWEKKIVPMFSDTRFAPKPGNYCRWCTFSKSQGGPCKF